MLDLAHLIVPAGVRSRSINAENPTGAAGGAALATWYAFRLDETTYGIFDTFESEDDRQAHVNGQIPAALQNVGSDLLVEPADIKPIDVLAVK